jgi:hypothetical protein
MNGGFGIETEESFVDLTDQFKAEGVDVDAVLRGNPNADLGRFKSGRAFVYGVLTLRVAGFGERVLKFGTSMRLGRPLMGMYGPPSYEYQAKLKTEGDNYIVPVEMSHSLKPGETDRLLVQLDADQSADHLMRLRFCGSGPNVEVQTPVEVFMVVPRSIAGKLREPSTAAGV